MKVLGINESASTQPSQGIVISTSSLALDPSTSEASRTVSLAGTTNPNVVTMSLIPFVNLPTEFIGDMTTAQPDGTILVNSDVLYFNISCMVKARFAGNDNIVLGIGIGNPADLPSSPGETTPGGTYVSRFVDAARGEGASRTETLSLPYSPVGKTRTLGATVGDKIFPVMWTEEIDVAVVVCDDFIFALTAVKQL